MSFTVKAAVAVVVAGLIAGVLFATGTVTIDHYAGAYGVSAGSSTRYCSADWAMRGWVTPLPMVSCEVAS